MLKSIPTEAPPPLLFRWRVQHKRKIKGKICKENKYLQKSWIPFFRVWFQKVQTQEGKTRNPAWTLYRERSISAKPPSTWKFSSTRPWSRLYHHETEHPVSPSVRSRFSIFPVAATVAQKRGGRNVRAHSQGAGEQSIAQCTFDAVPQPFVLVSFHTFLSFCGRGQGFLCLNFSFYQPPLPVPSVQAVALDPLSLIISFSSSSSFFWWEFLSQYQRICRYFWIGSKCWSSG